MLFVRIMQALALALTLVDPCAGTRRRSPPVISYRCVDAVEKCEAILLEEAENINLYAAFYDCVLGYNCFPDKNGDVHKPPPVSQIFQDFKMRQLSTQINSSQHSLQINSVSLVALVILYQAVLP
ncbi:uncharacterized protein LOC131950534 [Physella acuta]|uniref:uncharacterized protein LOC131950534 n=1 Tax=Physella acuta TaxID=109671 RepID=UPI0027DDCE23|nr:uncharacterized protein LOC131950534 [Physella acuta]XP_059168718.1 uncharacterized protein LOC131950534 [Physella acuta]